MSETGFDDSGKLPLPDTQMVLSRALIASPTVLPKLELSRKGLGGPNGATTRIALINVPGQYSGNLIRNSTVVSPEIASNTIIEEITIQGSRVSVTEKPSLSSFIGPCSRSLVLYYKIF